MRGPQQTALFNPKSCSVPTSVHQCNLLHLTVHDELPKMAQNALPAYRKHLLKEDWLKAVYAERYLNQRRFDGYSDSANDIDWAKCCDAVIRSGQWSKLFGPPPGQPGCKVPAELVTPELFAAVQSRGTAA